MNPTNINIRIEKDVKVAAEKIFEELGLNMTTAVNMFLRQTIRENGIPFELKVYAPNRTTPAAIAEGRRIAYDEGSKV
jgi:DNA-damage-inducible protein J